MTAITRKRGDTYPLEFTIKGDGVPLNITSCTFKLTVDSRKDPTDETTKLFTWIGSIVSAPAGTVQFLPILADVDHVGKFYFDLQMIDSAGFIITVEKDKWTFEQDITKAII